MASCPFFWHRPKSCGSTAENIFAGCQPQSALASRSTTSMYPTDHIQIAKSSCSVQKRSKSGQIPIWLCQQLAMENVPVEICREFFPLIGLRFSIVLHITVWVFVFSSASRCLRLLLLLLRRLLLLILHSHTTHLTHLILLTQLFSLLTYTTLLVFPHNFISHTHHLTKFFSSLHLPTSSHTTQITQLRSHNISTSVLAVAWSPLGPGCFCAAGAALCASGATFAWQAQHFAVSGASFAWQV